MLKGGRMFRNGIYLYGEKTIIVMNNNVNFDALS